MWACNLEGRIFDIAGKKLKAEKQLSEVLDERIGQRHVIANIMCINDKSSAHLKVRYELNPKHFDLDDPKEMLEIAEEHYCHEVDATKFLANARVGPRVIAIETQDQPEWMPYPGGYVDFIVMHTPYGENIDEIRDKLTNGQLDSIRTQLANILEKMRKKGYLLLQQHPSYLHYDVPSNKLYLTDLEALGFTDPTSSKSCPIDEQSPSVAAFNLWRVPYQKPTKAPEAVSMMEPQRGPGSAAILPSLGSWVAGPTYGESWYAEESAGRTDPSRAFPVVNTPIMCMGQMQPVAGGVDGTFPSEGEDWRLDESMDEGVTFPY
ncbi:hypothetical protein BO94DRAFT_227803 [Aspergillus sclerotioniger CBS 115572]|uniref:Uncharacterized protein n=1 Tax=Aspergillus sclerotioniger CBS 115572 TaxID=1450535 RepID=A0A317VJH6_9EURO|nr:hypothetical protein BO94DRAFT_227803 [Aspergillus sclerotioniger CBS 115572]PWY74514.1 hypothetical protein BO94DRAFT_227803 [Aspergillus sclerotioniger CBS 115572]